MVALWIPMLNSVDIHPTVAGSIPVALIFAAEAQIILDSNHP